MASNSEMINELVSKEALDELERLDKLINQSNESMGNFLINVGKFVEWMNKADKSASNAYKAQEKDLEINKEFVNVIQNENKLQQQKSDLTEKIINSVKAQSKAQTDLNANGKQEEEAIKRISKLLEQAVGKREDNIKALLEEQKALRALKTDMLELEEKRKYVKDYKPDKEGSESAKYIQEKIEIIAKEQEHKQAISDLQITLRNQEKISRAMAGSMNEESQILGNLRMAWRNLNEEQKNTAAGQQLLATITELDQKLKQNDATIGNHQRKVGNYEIAAKTLQTELLNVKQALMEMSLAGEKGSEAYEELSKKAEELQKVIIATNKEIKTLAQPGANLQAVTQGVQLVVAGYTAWKAVSTTLGIENEALDKSIKKLMSAMAALQALQQINNSLFKHSALAIKLSAWWQGVKAKATKEATVAQIANNTATATGTAVQGANTAATAAQTVAAEVGTVANIGLAGAFRLVGAAIKSIPVFGWIAAAIGVLIGVVERFRSKQKKQQQEAIKRYDEEIKKIKEYNDVISKGYGDQIGKINAMRAAIDSENISNENKLKIIEKLKKEIPGYNVELDDTGRIIRENTKAIDDYLIGLEKMLKFQAAQGKLMEIESKIMELNLSDIGKQYEWVQDMEARARKEREKGNDEEARRLIEATNDFNTNIQNYTQQLNRLNKEKQKYIDYIKKEGLIENDFSETKGSSEIKTEGKTDRYDQKIILQQMKDEMDAQKRIMENERETYENRMQAAEEYYLKQAEHIKKQAEFQIQNENATGDHLRYIKMVENAALLSLDDDFAKKREAIFKNLVQQQIKAAQEEIQAIQEEKTIAMEDDLRIANEKYLEETKQNLANKNKKEKIERDYQMKRLEIIRKYNQAIFEEELKLLKEVLKSTGLSEAEILKIQQQISKLQIKNANEVADYEMKLTEEKTKAEEEQFVRKTKAVQEIRSMAFDVVNSYYDNEIQRIDELMAKNQEMYDEKLRLLEENNTAGLLSDEYYTAERKKLLERQKQDEEKLSAKKKELQTKQAKWQKVNAVIQATINTAQAITSAIGVAPPLGIALAAIIGALGAAQIATIVSQKIPEYKEGTDFHPGGIAKVGEGGVSEIVDEPKRGLWKTPAHPTFVNLERGAKVYANTKEWLKENAFGNHMFLPNITQRYDKDGGDNFTFNSVPDEVSRKYLRNMDSNIRAMRGNTRYAMELERQREFYKDW